jgi:5-deoxy-glucuronate isomerase
MLIKNPGSFDQGYTSITAVAGPHPEMRMDFGILKLRRGAQETSRAPWERAYLLMDGEVDLRWEGGERRIARRSLFDEPPLCLHLPLGAEVSVTALSELAELAYQATENPTEFAPRFYAPADCRIEQRGKGTMRETSTRIVRTILDQSNAPHSNLVLGEVVNYPGKWSSYPPHYHPQPEIYHYRFMPEEGFGLAAIGEKGLVLRQNDTVLIHDGEVHPQVAAPGYAMYYLWVIRHLEDSRYGTPTFVPEHRWVMDPQAKIWP